MRLLRDIASELAGMFLADMWLALAILLLVGLIAALGSAPGARPLVDGGLLLLGCLAILVAGAVRAARRR